MKDLNLEEFGGDLNFGPLKLIEFRSDWLDCTYRRDCSYEKFGRYT